MNETSSDSSAQPREETWTLNAFPTLLMDAMIFDIMANSVDPPVFNDINRHAKVAFLNAVLSLECAANACLDPLNAPFSSKTIQLLDKAQPLDKYEVLLFAKSGSQLDYGNIHCQTAKELFTFRNSYVHPKLARRQRRVTRVGPNTHIYEGKTQLEESQFLKLPKDMDAWDVSHSRLIVKTTIKFLNYFFINQCKMTTEQCTEFLAPHSLPSGALFLPAGASQIFAQAPQIYGTKILFLEPAAGSQKSPTTWAFTCPRLRLCNERMSYNKPHLASR